MFNWFPGHMAKAFKQIKEIAPVIDLFIVTLDSRAPISSYNEDFDKIEPNKPRLFVITKSDLGDSEKLSNVLTKFNHNKDHAIIVNLKERKSKKIIDTKINMLLQSKRERDLKKGFARPRLNAIVIGVPNSGKSTLINTLAGKNKTRTANKPGVTRGKQWVNTGRFMLLDTPGILWPKLEEDSIGVKLAIIDSIKNDLIPLQELFYESYKLLSSYYPEKVGQIGLEPITENNNKVYNQLVVFSEMKRLTIKGNQPDLNKAMRFFLKYLKSLKGVTYES